MPSLEAPPVEQALVFTFTFCLRLHPELHFLPNRGLKHVLLICADWLPILDSICITRPSGLVVSQEDEGYMIVCVIHGDRWDRRDARSPNLGVKRSKASDLPSLFITNTSNFIEKSWLGRPECNENVICKEFDIDLGHIWMRLDKGEELSSIHRCYQVTCVKDRALDLEIPAGFVLRVVVVDHTLDFGGLDDWIECFHLICDLDHVGCYFFPMRLCCWGKDIGVEALKEVAKTFSADKVLVLHTRSIGIPRTVLAYLRRSVSRPHPCRCVPDLLG